MVGAAACVGNLRANLVRSHQAAQITLATIDDTERVLCFGSTVVPTVANHCTTEAAKLAGLNDATHQAIHVVLNKGFRAQIELADAIDAWTPGTKVDLSVLTGVAQQLQQLVGTLTNTQLPDLAKLITQAASWKAEVDRLRELFGKSDLQLEGVR
jgi:hypothetical protein